MYGMTKNGEMKFIWQEVTVVVSQTAADLLSEKLIELGSQGTVFHDHEDDPNLCKILAYYPTSVDVDAIITEITRYLDRLQTTEISPGNVDIRSTLLEDTDWNAEWKKFFHPTRIGKHFIIKPSWEEWAAQPDDLIIEIDPGMAFGTGLHASTRLMLRLMEQYLRPGNRVLDVGVGSGILTIAAARLGASYVYGVDIDAEAVQIAWGNVVRNAGLTPQAEVLQDRIELEVGSLDTITVNERFDCILMNIRPNIILPLIPYAEAFLQTGGAVIISGILEEEGTDLVDELRDLHFLVQDSLVEEDWAAYVLSHLSRTEGYLSV